MICAMSLTSKYTNFEFSSISTNFKFLCNLCIASRGDDAPDAMFSDSNGNAMHLGDVAADDTIHATLAKRNWTSLKVRVCLSSTQSYLICFRNKYARTLFCFLLEDVLGRSTDFNICGIWFLEYVFV